MLEAKGKNPNNQVGSSNDSLPSQNTVPLNRNLTLSNTNSSAENVGNPQPAVNLPSITTTNTRKNAHQHSFSRVFILKGNLIDVDRSQIKNDSISYVY